MRTMKKFVDALTVHKAIETTFKVEARQILIFIVTRPIVSPIVGIQNQ